MVGNHHSNYSPRFFQPFYPRLTPRVMADELSVKMVTKLDGLEVKDMLKLKDMPHLVSPTMPDIWSWQIAIKEKLSLFPGLRMPFARLLSPDVLEVWSLTTRTDPSKFPNTLEETIETLNKSFRPTAMMSRRRFVISFTSWIFPTCGPLLVSFRRHTANFVKCCDAMELDAEMRGPLFLSTLVCLADTFRVVTARFNAVCESHPTVRMITEAFEELLTMRDAAIDEGLFSEKLPTSKFAMKDRSFSRPTSVADQHPARREERHSDRREERRSDRRESTEKHPGWFAMAKTIPQEERNRRKMEHVCLCCASPDHFLDSCPILAATTAAGSTLPRSVAPSSAPTTITTLARPSGVAPSSTPMTPTRTPFTGSRTSARTSSSVSPAFSVTTVAPVTPMTASRKSPTRSRTSVAAAGAPDAMMLCDTTAHDDAECPDLIPADSDDEEPDIADEEHSLAQDMHTVAVPDGQVVPPVDDTDETDAEDAHVLTVPEFDAKAHRVILHVALTEPPGVMAEFYVDCASDHSTMRRSYAEKLGLTLTPGPRMNFTSFAGKVKVHTQTTTIKCRLTDDGPDREISIHVCENSPPGDYILLGSIDHRDYDILGSMPRTLSWRGGISEEDQSDSIEVPIEPVQSHVLVPTDHIPVAVSDSIAGTPIGDVDLPDPPDPKSLENIVMPSVQMSEDSILTAPERVIIQNTTKEFADVYGPLDHEPAHVEPFRVELIDGAQPIRSPRRHTTPLKLAIMRKEAEYEDEMGFAVKSSSEWAAQELVVHQEGKDRVCQDLQGPNAVTKVDAYPIADQDELVRFAMGARYAIQTDIKSAFKNCPTDPETRHILAFVTPLGLREPTRVLFGARNAPPYFHRVIGEMINNEHMARWLKNFFDDCVLGAKTFGEFATAYRRFLFMCRKYHFFLKPEKTIICPRVLHVVGRIVQDGTVQADPSRFSAWNQAPIPRSKAVLHSFLGAAQWFSSFVPHMATIIGPLWDLLKGKVVWEWTAAHQRAWEYVKQAIADSEVLFYPILGALMYLFADASKIGIAAALFQHNTIETRWELVSLWSRKLTTAERKYSTIEQEALAVVGGMVRFRVFIQGPIIAHTDHSNLRFMETSENPRVQRLRIVLGEFEYSIRYNPGKFNILCDYLTRNFPGADDDTVETVDAQLCVVRNSTIELGREVTDLPHTLDGTTVVLNAAPPKDIEMAILAIAHADVMAGHGGKTRTLARIQPIIRWPGLSESVKDFVRSCSTCQKLRAEAPTIPELASTRSHAPYDSIFIDYLGPLTQIGELNHILVMADRFSRELVLEATGEPDATTTARLLYERWFCVKGIPKFITSDGASHFTEHDHMEELTRILHVNHHISAPYHPEGHSAVERQIYTVTQSIRALVRESPDWTVLVKPIEFACNSAVSRMLGTSPFQVVHGFPARVLLHDVVGTDPVDHAEDPFDFSLIIGQKALEMFQVIEDIEDEQYKDATAKQRELSAHGQVDYAMGDYVIIKFPRKQKLDVEWQGPFEVLRRDPEFKYHYFVRDLISNEEIRVHVNRLHEFQVGDMSPEDITAETSKFNEFRVESVLTTSSAQETNCTSASNGWDFRRCPTRTRMPGCLSTTAIGTPSSRITSPPMDSHGATRARVVQPTWRSSGRRQRRGRRQESLSLTLTSLLTPLLFPLGPLSSLTMSPQQLPPRSPRPPRSLGTLPFQTWKGEVL